MDALRDLDDALSLLFLFANLPSTSNVKPKTIRLCQRLCHEFQHFIILSHSLRKSFLSIKGIYYQATIQGQDILWLVPYKFVQRVTSDVDFRIMGTFVEFYMTLLGFVNYRLYSSVGLVYPPRFNAGSDERGAELGAFTIEGINLGGEVVEQENRIDESNTKTLTNGSVTNIPIPNSEEALQKAITAQIESEEVEAQSLPLDVNSNDIDNFVVTAEDADILAQPQVSDFDAAKLFNGMHVFISRESPRQPLEFIVKAFGCKRVSWPEILGEGAFTHNETDDTITHQIIDRPSMPSEDSVQESDSSKIRAGYIMPGRTYVQPQWIWDSINANKLLRPDLYSPGSLLPPHLSPWVKPKEGMYDPSIPLVEQEAEGEAEDAADTIPVLPPSALERVDEIDDVELEEDNEEVDDHGMQIAEDHEDEEDEEGDESDAVSNIDDFTGFPEEDTAILNEEEPKNDLHEVELAAEVAGLDSTLVSEDPEVKARQEAKKGRQRKKQQDEEELQRQLGMMSKKKRKLYEKMRYSNQQKENDAAKLRAKRRKIEQS